MTIASARYSQAMSGESLEVVRRVYRAFSERGEWPWDMFATDLEFDASGVMPDMPPGHGVDTARSLFRSYAEMFEEFETQLEEVVAADGEHVVTAVRDGGRIKGSAAPVWNRYFHAWTVHDGVVVAWSTHLNKERALEAAAVTK